MRRCAEEGCDRQYQARGLCGMHYARRRREVLPPCLPVSPPVRDALAATGLTYRMLDYWARVGYLKPTGGVGSGSHRRWPDGEIAVAKDMHRLVSAGLTVEAAHRVARAGGCAWLAAGVYVQMAASRTAGVGDQS